ncbi:hypothetical protein DPEC_G00338430 [Dallia pectoralis]|uniref:Uncharacterized protein n=1 Tax=Dallia pectoralis TaxID=75939 RepID=A0ACC2F4J1_DALPE|nr:hypothetical protein DPEC_G00338430 [Dallia pectoralis]
MPLRSNLAGDSQPSLAFSTEARGPVGSLVLVNGALGACQTQVHGHPAPVTTPRRDYPPDPLILNIATPETLLSLTPPFCFPRLVQGHSLSLGIALVRAALCCHYSAFIDRELRVGLKAIRWAGKQIIEPLSARGIDPCCHPATPVTPSRYRAIHGGATGSNDFPHLPMACFHSELIANDNRRAGVMETPQTLSVEYLLEFRPGVRRFWDLRACRVGEGEENPARICILTP